ncbi:MAG TPA: FAD-binding protein, partial [Bryobacteraceae bacterium]|nr:FAD-binding protein [Bryobacteraceae bacterium]
MVPESALQQFRTSLRGQLFTPGEPGYEEARKIHNALIDRRPAVIARCAGVADVISAVNFGRGQSVVVSVRGAGHNVAGTSLCDGGMVIDLSAMKGIHVNPVARTARVEPGV